jgi:hypothetical protein
MKHKAEPTIACVRDPAGERTLLVAARNGDEQAFETLFKRHQRKTFAVVLRTHVWWRTQKTSFSKASTRLSRICPSSKENPPSPPG